MDPRMLKKILLFAVLDAILLFLVGLIKIHAVEEAIFPAAHRNGFFCSDESIRYPYSGNTVSGKPLSFITTLVPLAVILMLEAWNHLRPLNKATVIECLLRFLKIASIFIFGYFAMSLIVIVGKSTVGKLRPHFLETCELYPDVCNNASDPHKYHVEFTCVSEHPDYVENSRKSFPSRHAADAFYSSVFLMMYFQYVFPRCGLIFLRFTIQLLLLLWGWFVAISRVKDHRHHPSDVLAGGIIGTLVAVFLILVVSDLRQYSYRLVNESGAADTPDSEFSTRPILPA